MKPLKLSDIPAGVRVPSIRRLEEPDRDFPIRSFRDDILLAFLADIRAELREANAIMREVHTRETNNLTAFFDEFLEEKKAPVQEPPGFVISRVR